MRTAVMIPDDVFAAADQAARQLGWSRSKFYSTAISEYLADTQPDPITEALNRVADELAAESTPNIGRAIIEAGDWEW